MSLARLDTKNARQHLQAFEFTDLFIEDLGWNLPTSRKPVLIENEGVVWRANEISQLSGFRVFEISAEEASIPGAKAQEAIWKRIALESVENILIFLDAKRTQALWLWMKREGTKVRPRRHVYIRGQPGDLFLSKLGALVVDLSELDEAGNLPITDTANRVRAALDVEAVTKTFFKNFQDEHGKFLDQISGIPNGGDRRWYASVILNRLMFVWFLQKKQFLDGGNADYLPEKLAASQAAGKDRFFSHFLRDLFFEGFAKPEAKRHCVGPVPVGDIPYLNGGLFLPHGIEHRIEAEALFHAPYGKIRIPDKAFVAILGTEQANGHKGLFASFTWNLNDTPGGDDREINPDVLGYIFEKYINQKEFGAYYTRPEITEYLCEQTIHQLLLDAANDHARGQKMLAQYNVKNGPSAPREFADAADVLLHANGSLARHLLQDVIPRLSLLDPACGSGAFLVAAMKTLLALTTGLLGRCEAVQEKAVLQWVEHERRKHRAPLAYWLKKKIITENLYGVDIMEEAVEIAKLRLFLALVASAESRDQLEPLPNIEFNLMAGNSLIGLLRVDASRYDTKTGAGKAGQERITFVHEPDALGLAIESKTAPTMKERQGAHLEGRKQAKYDELLLEKNRLVDLYKKSAVDFEDLSALKLSIEAKKQEARSILDKMLLDEFDGLGIKFEQATWDDKKKKEGRPEKRALRLADIRALQPFHWAYEFDDILVSRGGFDAIITNPPWENFKPDDKEFFMPFAEGVSKNKMRLEEFVERKTDILSDEHAIRAQYLAYLSRFPHVNLWFRNAEQYENQTTIVNGRKATTDLNLYKLFLEQTLHLTHSGGYCGIVIPSGIYSDLGATRLRQMLFEKTRITGLFGFENRKEIFESVHRSFKFVVLTFRAGDKTTKFPAAFMRHEVSDLATFPENGALEIEIKLIRQLSPDSQSIAEFRDEEDVSVARKLAHFPMLGDTSGHPWHLKFQREFHMTDDSALYHVEKRAGYVPLVEGKMFHQFRYPFAEPRYWLDPKAARAALLSARLNALRRLAEELGIKLTIKPEQVKLDYESYRLVFRDVARNTDERTMMATILPPNVFCPHTVSMEVVYHDEIEERQIKLNVTAFGDFERLYLAAALNSFVVDYQLRQKVNAHLSFFYLHQLPLPRLANKDPAFRPLVERAARLVGTSAEFDDLLREIFGPKATHRTHGVADPAGRQRLRAEIDALVARLYGLTEDEFQHILGTFPLVDESVKSQTRNTFRELLKLGKLAS